MSESKRSVLLGTSALAAALGIALALTLARSAPREDPLERERLVRLLLLAIGVQSLHFVEELATGFQRAFPESLGLAPWTDEFFVTFNVAWIVIWVLSAMGLRASVRGAVFPVWILAIAMVGNGIAHPLLSLRAGGYFPGLVTSFIEGIVGGTLLARLFRVTRPSVRMRALA